MAVVPAPVAPTHELAGAHFGEAPFTPPWAS